MKEEDFEDFDFSSDVDSNESSFDFEPQRMDANTFKQRNDPKDLLERYKLQLLNAYKEKKVIKDGGSEKVIFKLRFKKNTVPKCNRQGVEDLISYVEKVVNNHTVQGNILSIEEFRTTMRHVSCDITMHFMVMRSAWGIKITDIDSIIASSINLVELFLSRTLNNEERRSYGESYKETTNREIKPAERAGFMQRLGSFLGGKR